MSKYKVGDRFVVEIGEVFDNSGEYRAEGTNTLYLNDAQLDKLEQVKEHDGCNNCKYYDKEREEYPCNQCMYNHTSQYKPKPPKPHWIKKYVGYYVCSECGGEVEVETPYCPFCGAKMESEE